MHFKHRVSTVQYNGKKKNRKHYIFSVRTHTELRKQKQKEKNQDLLNEETYLFL